MIEIDVVCSRKGTSVSDRSHCRQKATVKGQKATVKGYCLPSGLGLIVVYSSSEAHCCMSDLCSRQQNIGIRKIFCSLALDEGLLQVDRNVLRVGHKCRCEKRNFKVGDCRRL